MLNKLKLLNYTTQHWRDTQYLITFLTTLNPYSYLCVLGVTFWSQQTTNISIYIICSDGYWHTSVYHMYVYNVYANQGFNGARLSSGSANDCFEKSVVWILHWPNVNFSGHKVWIGTLRWLCLCKFDISGRRMMAAHKTGSEIWQGHPNASCLI